MIKRETVLFVLLAGFLVVSLAGAGCSQSETEEAVEEEDQAVETTEETVVKTDTTDKTIEKTEATDSTEKTDTTTDKKVEWKLVSGDPSDTCSAPTYEGEVEVSGWYVYDYSYVEKTWLLQIIDEDVSKIPIKEVYGEESYNQWVEKPQFLFDATAEQVEELKKASEDKPVKVTIKAFRAYCEGAPQLSQTGFGNIWQ
ncbi:hypothetical protein KJ903_02165 [Patescibacteria group bacterium]|nr:hypothetical protein [Patescibacteria group bacterium]